MPKAPPTPKCVICGGSAQTVVFSILTGRLDLCYRNRCLMLFDSPGIPAQPTVPLTIENYTPHILN